MKTALSTIFFLAIFSTISNAAIIEYSDDQKNFDTVSRENFFESNVIGDRQLLLSGRQSGLNFTVDTDSMTAFSEEFDFEYYSVPRVITARNLFRILVDNPFPQEDTYEDIYITERLVINGLSGSGSFSSTSPMPLRQAFRNGFKFGLPLVGTTDLVLTGHYSLEGPTQRFSRSFEYNITSEPSNSNGLILLTNGEPILQVEKRFVEIEPVDPVLYNGNFDGVRINSQLMPLTIPVTVPEPKSFILVLLALMVFFFTRKPNV